MKNKYFSLVVLVFFVFLAPFVQAADENVQDAAYWKKEADKLIGKREYDKALDYCKKSLAIDPRYARSIFCVAFIYDIKGKFAESLSHLDQAMELVKSGKDTSKLPIGDIYAEKGYILVLQGKYQDALPLYDLAILSDPQWSYPVFWKAFALFKMNDLDKALEFCNKALKIKPDYNDAQKLKGMIEKQMIEKQK